jgi:hypothetical protein
MWNTFLRLKKSRRNARAELLRPRLLFPVFSLYLKIWGVQRKIIKKIAPKQIKKMPKRGGGEYVVCHGTWAKKNGGISIMRNACEAKRQIMHARVAAFAAALLGILFFGIAAKAFGDNGISTNATDLLLQQAEVAARELSGVTNALRAFWVDEYRTWRDSGSIPGPGGGFPSAWCNGSTGSWTPKSGLLSTLVTKGYLPSGFPVSNFSLSSTNAGDVTVQYTLDETIAQYVPVYLPLASVSGTAVSLLAQRPEEYLIAETVLPSEEMVRRDGKRRDGMGELVSGPTFEDGAEIRMGANATLGWDDGTGRIYGVAQLNAASADFGQLNVDDLQATTLTADTGTVKNLTVTNTLRLEDSAQGARLRTNNTSGTWFQIADSGGSVHLTVTRGGDLYASSGSANRVYHTGNIGSLGLDATWLDRGILPRARLSGTYDINVTGKSDTAGLADRALKLETPRNIAIAGDVTGNVDFDGTKDVTITLTTGGNLAQRNEANPNWVNTGQWTFQGLRVGMGGAGVYAPAASAGEAIEIATSSALAGGGGNAQTGARIFAALPAGWDRGGELRFQAASGLGTYYDASVTVRKDGLVAKSLMFDGSTGLQQLGTTENELRIAVGLPNYYSINSGGTTFFVSAKSLVPDSSGENLGVLVARDANGNIATNSKIVFSGVVGAPTLEFRESGGKMKLFANGNEVYTSDNLPLEVLSLNDLKDVNVGTPSDKQGLVYSNGKWNLKRILLLEDLSGGTGGGAPVGGSEMPSGLVASNPAPLSLKASAYVNAGLFPVEIALRNESSRAITVRNIRLYDGSMLVTDYAPRAGIEPGQGNALSIPALGEATVCAWVPLSLEGEKKIIPGIRTWTIRIIYEDTSVKTLALSLPLTLESENAVYGDLLFIRPGISGAGAYPVSTR